MARMHYATIVLKLRETAERLYRLDSGSGDAMLFSQAADEITRLHLDVLRRSCTGGDTGDTAEELREKLKDPVVVHMGMLRGGIAKPSWANIKHLYPDLLVAADPHLQPIITEEMIEAGAKAIAPEVWAADPATFGHPDSLNRRGHELCKSKVRAQAGACLEAAIGSYQLSSK